MTHWRELPPPPGQPDPQAQRIADLEAQEIARLRPLATFGRAVLTQHRNGGEPGDCDGGWLQDTAIAAGLLAEVAVASPCEAEGCGGSCCDDGVCLRETVLAALDKDGK